MRSSVLLTVVRFQKVTVRLIPTAASPVSPVGGGPAFDGDGGFLNSAKALTDSSRVGVPSISRSFSGVKSEDGNLTGPLFSERPYLTRATLHSALSIWMVM